MIKFNDKSRPKKKKKEDKNEKEIFMQVQMLFMKVED